MVRVLCRWVGLSVGLLGEAPRTGSLVSFGLLRSVVTDPLLEGGLRVYCSGEAGTFSRNG